VENKVEFVICLDLKGTENVNYIVNIMYLMGAESVNFIVI
jgi:hypothetical protein